MKKIITVLISLFLVFGLTLMAHADLNGFLDKVNIEANADMNGFAIKLSNQFDVPLQQVNTIIKSVKLPADAFMCLQLSLMTRKKPDMVMQTYKKSKGKGWGVIAKRLGVKPGSPEFHAIKSGDFVFDGMPAKTEKEKRKKKK